MIPSQKLGPIPAETLANDAADCVTAPMPCPTIRAVTPGSPRTSAPRPARDRRPGSASRELPPPRRAARRTTHVLRPRCRHRRPKPPPAFGAPLSPRPCVCIPTSVARPRNGDYEWITIRPPAPSDGGAPVDLYAAAGWVTSSPPLKALEPCYSPRLRSGRWRNSGVFHKK